jgi:hypothetical protein
MTSHRIKDRRKPVRIGVLVSVLGIAVNFRIIAWAGLPLIDDLMCLLRRPVETARRNRELRSRRSNYQTPKTSKADKLMRHGEALQNGTPANLGS